MFLRDWCHLGHGMRLVRGRKGGREEGRKGGKNGREKERKEGRTEEGRKAGQKKAAPVGAAGNKRIDSLFFPSDRYATYIHSSILRSKANI